MRIGGHEIGKGVYVIAELGVNHDGSVSRALELVDAAAWAGADAIKLQLFRTDMLMSRAAKLAAYQKASGESDPLAMLRRLELCAMSMEPIIERAHEHGLGAIVSIFSVELVPEACAQPWDAFKSASPDIINRPLLDAMAASGKPMIVSTGTADAGEVRRALGWLRCAADRLALLQCVSSYPVPRGQEGLDGIGALALLHTGPVGYSDHTGRAETGALAVMAGAVILEVHLTYDRSATGPDHAASLESADLQRYVRSARAATPGPVRTTDPDAAKRVEACERDVRLVSRQSLTTTRALVAGHVLSRHDLTIRRPGTGIEPYRLEEVIGRSLARDLEADMPLTEEDIA